jgi:hypothetical protein
MKNLIIIVALGICLFACTPSSEKINSENIALVKAYVNSVENLDFESMANYLDDNYLGMGPSFGDSIRKEEAVQNWKMNVETLYEKIHYNRSRFASVTIPDGDNQGNWVGNWAEMNIVFKDGMGTVTVWANTNYLVANGKILKTITFYNEADVLRQLGFRTVRF